MAYDCTTQVPVGFSEFKQRETGDGTVTRTCGEYYAGDMQLCEKHRKLYSQRYPQGWESYPGDVCKHGTYVGGCGADLMCGACEQGD